MKTLATLICLIGCLCSTTNANEERIYLAAGDKLTVFSINLEAGTLEPIQEIDLPGAGPFRNSPTNEFLYAMAGKGKGNPPEMATFQIASDGKLSLLHQASIQMRAGYLNVDETGSYIAGNHYGPGKASIWQLDGDGIFRGKSDRQIDLEPKAHSAVFSPNNRWLLIPATGPNKVFVQSFDSETGKVAPAPTPFAPGPKAEGSAQQPRHLIFHPKLPVIYTTNEREEPGVGVWSWDASAGKLKTVENHVTKPEGFTGTMSTADLHLTPDARFLYVSNRDVTDRNSVSGTNSLAGFSVDQATGSLSRIGAFPCEHVPRSFTIHPSGKFVVVAGQGDNRLGVYRLNSATGELTKTAQYETGKRPIWVAAF